MGLGATLQFRYHNAMGALFGKLFSRIGSNLEVVEELRSRVRHHLNVPDQCDTVLRQFQVGLASLHFTRAVQMEHGGSSRDGQHLYRLL